MIYCDARKRGILMCQADEELHAMLTDDPVKVSPGSSIIFV